MYGYRVAQLDVHTCVVMASEYSCPRFSASRRVLATQGSDVAGAVVDIPRFFLEPGAHAKCG